MPVSLVDALNIAYTKIPAINQSRINKYLFENATLEEASSADPDSKITRERVRQIKNKFLKLALSNLDSGWSKLVEEYCINNNCGIMLESLSLIDPFFEGIDTYLQKDPTNFINEFFANTNLKLDTYKNSHYLISKESLYGDELSKHIVDTYLSDMHEKLSFKENIEMFCELEGREEIAGEVFDEILLKVKSSKQRLAKVCADELFALGHIFIDPKKVLDHSKEFYGDIFHDTPDGLRSLEAVMSRIDGVQLISKHRYSKYEYFPGFLKEDEDQLLSIIEEIINSNPERQWHLKNVIKLINEEPAYYSSLSKHCLDKLDHVSANFIMKYFEGTKHDLNYLSMYVWSVQDASVNARVDINSLAYEIIEDNGSPMAIREIKSKIMEKRGIRGTTQIHVNESTPNVLPFAPKVYGIRSRDFKITIEDEERMFFLLRESIQSKSYILGEDFKALLKDEDIDTHMNDYQLGRFLQRGVKNRVITGSYWVKLYKEKFAVVNIKTPREDVPNLRND